MSIRHLDSLLEPASVAVIGASNRPASVGATVWRNVHGGSYRGTVYAINPKHAELDGERVYARVADLPDAPELALICTPPATVAPLIAELGERGTRAVVVLTAGLDKTQRQQMLDASRLHLVRILGPNCIGLLAPHLGLNASFAPTGVVAGDIAFVSQSGALMTALLDWAAERSIGFSHFVSLGDHADVDFGDMLDWLASDPRTRSILLYIESIEAPKKFMSAARAAARNKPVIVVKAGRSKHGQSAAASHTGALAGSDLVFDAAIRRAGMLRVETLRQLFGAAETLARLRTHRGGPLAVLTNGGGAGVMAADAAEAAGLALADLSDETRARLDAALPANWSHGNPVDIIGDAPAERYVAAVDALLADKSLAGVLFIHAPTAIVPADAIAEALLPRAAQDRGRLLTCWLGGRAVAGAMKTFRDAGIAAYATPEDAVRALSILQTYRLNQEQLLEAPPAACVGGQGAPDLADARALIETVLAEGRELMTEPEAKELLAAYGIPVVPTRVVPADPAAAAAAAAAIGQPVALKILSPDITHKSDVGGVALNLDTPDEVHQAAVAMLARVADARPEARLAGFTVQAMVRRPRAQELIVGANIDNVFGPTILFGQGGTAVEVLADRAIGLPPLNQPLARAMVQRTRVAKLLEGYRDTPAADMEAVHAVLIAVSQMLADLPEIAELDINPLLADDAGVIALDARVRVSAARPGGAKAFAITPYPSEYVETIAWQGRALTLRPIRPEDEAAHLAFLQHLDPEDVRLRVFYSRRSIERSELARLTQIDYAREIAFVAVAPDEAGADETLGVARAVCNPDHTEAEFGIVVRSDLKGRHLGELLMHKLIRTLREQGVRRLVATVLTENANMRALGQALGFTDLANPEDRGTRLLTLELRPTPP